jgi:hypothetical protein
MANEGVLRVDPYDSHLNQQELSKMLLDLTSLYKDAAAIGVR